MHDGGLGTPFPPVLPSIAHPCGLSSVVVGKKSLNIAPKRSSHPKTHRHNLGTLAKIGADGLAHNLSCRRRHCAGSARPLRPPNGHASHHHCRQRRPPQSTLSRHCSVDAMAARTTSVAAEGGVFLGLMLLHNCIMASVCAESSVVLAAAGRVAFLHHSPLCLLPARRKQSSADRTGSTAGSSIETAATFPGHARTAILRQLLRCVRGNFATLVVREPRDGSGMMSCRRGVLLLVATGLLDLGGVVPASAQASNEEDEEEEHGIMSAPCAKECMPK